MNSLFREFSARGARFVTSEAIKAGFSSKDPDWVNLGQGQPELGELDGAPPRIKEIQVDSADYGYGPVDGLPALKQRVADHYNRLYRRGLPSQYTAENVAIAAGGRVALTRALSAMGPVKLGLFSPDYMAFEDAVASFASISPQVIKLSAADGFKVPVDQLIEKQRRGEIEALLFSNPCNPSGNIIQVQALRSLVEAFGGPKSAIIIDEYYSHYIWDGSDAPKSAASLIDDVDASNVVILDGITKNYRYPGFRIGWLLAAKQLINKFTAAGSFLDGGPPLPTQRAALQVLVPELADRETTAIRRVFAVKRDFLLSGLGRLGIKVPSAPDGTFYVYGSLENLPAPLNNCLAFFREALNYKIVTVPGEFFDLCPGMAAQGTSPLAGSLASYVRFSFGSPLEALERGLESIKEMLQRA